MTEDPLAPARGIMWGLVLGFCLYVVAALIGWGIVALARDDGPACEHPLYGPGIGGPIVECP
jgi:hypothetical protein